MKFVQISEISESLVKLTTIMKTRNQFRFSMLTKKKKWIQWFRRGEEAILILLLMKIHFTKFIHLILTLQLKRNHLVNNNRLQLENIKTKLFQNKNFREKWKFEWFVMIVQFGIIDKVKELKTENNFQHKFVFAWLMFRIFTKKINF